MSSHDSLRRRILLGCLALAVGAMVLGQVGPAAAHDELARVRAATAKYHRIDAALADGYVLGYNGIITGCIAHPTDGAMGYHYFRSDLIEDPTVDPLRPEGLVYQPQPSGGLKLVAVEWIVPGPVPPDPSLEPPVVLDQDMHVLNPVLGWYIHHAWVWKHNPAGMFDDWNPEVTCP